MYRKTVLNSPCPECLHGEFMLRTFRMPSNLLSSRAKNWFHSLFAAGIGANLGRSTRERNWDMGKNQGGWQCDAVLFSPLYNRFKLETRFGSEIACYGSISGPPDLLWIKRDGLGGKHAESVHRLINFPHDANPYCDLSSSDTATHKDFKGLMT